MVLLRQNVTLTYDPAPGDITVVPGGSSQRLIASQPPQVIDIFNQPQTPLPTTQIDQLIGPYQTVAEAAANTDLSGSFAQQDVYQDTFGDVHFNSPTGSFIADNYYDRVFSWHVFHIRGADVKWRNRATQLLSDYIAPISQNNTNAPRNSFMEGAALDQLVNGINPTILQQMGFQADNLRVFTVANMADPNYQWNEGRILARVGVAQLMSWFMGNTSQNYGLFADQYKDVAIQTQLADGSYRWQLDGQNTPPPVYGNSNFMHGIVGTWLAKWVRCRNAGVWPADIRNWFLLSADYFRTQWIANGLGFQYRSISTDGAKSGLNQLIAGTLAIAHYLGHPQAGVWGDEAYFGGVDGTSTGVPGGAWLQNYKQYNQQYFDAHNFFFYRNNIL